MSLFALFTLVLFAICYSVPRSSYAADFQISATIDRPQVPLNEKAVLSVVISGGSSLPSPKLPDLPPFQVYPAGQSQSVSISNQVSRVTTYTYILTPRQEGVFKIPPIVAEKDGQTAETIEMTLEVVKADAAAAPGNAAPAASRDKPGAAAIFVTGTVDKTSVYVGEPVVYSFRLYNRVQLLRQPGYQAPETSGFWSEDLPPQRNYQTSVKGVPYQVTEVRRALFPTSPGKAHIGSGQLQVMMENIGRGDPFSSNFFASFFNAGEQRILKTEPITVNVKPLPEPKPAAFKGAVGQFTIATALDKTEASVGQPVTLTITLSGRGNIKSLPDVSLPPLQNFRMLADNAASSVDSQEGQVRGSKVFKTVLIPTTSGDLPIPSIPYVYFDIDSKTYKTLATKPFVLKVSAGTAAASSSVPLGTTSGSTPQANAPGVQRLSEDIRYIRTSGKAASQSRPLYQQGWFRWLHLLLFLGVGGFGLFRLYEKLFLSDKRLARFKAASAQAASAIAQAEKADAMAQALQRYLADKLGLEAGEVSLRSVQEILRRRGVSAHSVEKIRNLWETLDLYRFAPAQARPDDVVQAKAALRLLVEGLEKEILWKD